MHSTYIDQEKYRPSSGVVPVQRPVYLFRQKELQEDLYVITVMKFIINIMIILKIISAKYVEIFYLQEMMIK